ncbi:hypothetical protein [Bifidobacterium longum]|jgi:hypothetical protein|uniref:hypothetical protein n=1 Tax=Bifidobacterium longum TaxID=216816 RepID=UPI003B9AC63A
MAAIVPCVPPLQPGTNRLSHNSGSSSPGVGAIPTAILGFEGLISWFGDIYFRFKGLVIGQTQVRMASRQRHFAVLELLLLGHQPLETEVDVSERANQPLETQIDDCESAYQPRRTCNRDVGVSFPGLIARMS